MFTKVASIGRTKKTSNPLLARHSLRCWSLHWSVHWSLPSLTTDYYFFIIDCPFSKRWLQVIGRGPVAVPSRLSSDDSVEAELRQSCVVSNDSLDVSDLSREEWSQSWQTVGQSKSELTLNEVFSKVKSLLNKTSVQSSRRSPRVGFVKVLRFASLTTVSLFCCLSSD